MSEKDDQIAQFSLDSPRPKSEDVVVPVPRLRRAAALVLYNTAAVLVLLLMFEGAASTYYAFRNAFDAPPVAESLYTEYDRDLGWVSLPNIYRPNMYGSGKFLKTNSQRFRNDVDFTKRVPPGKTRLICSGDSFTFGFGVDNEHTWPQLLAAQASNIETVNMGQGGYGASQAYLWYKRDGVALDYDIQILALIYPDLYRMQHSSFNGYGKPVLSVENDGLVVSNVPVPRSMQVWMPRFVRAENALSNLTVTRLLRNALKLDAAAPVAPSEERNQQTARVLSYMLDDLLATNRARNSILVLVYLPIREELGWKSTEYWREILAEYARQHSVFYVDLTDGFRSLPSEELDKFFIPGRAMDVPGAAGHYTEEGNAFVANSIYRRLLANPETAAKFHTR